jgi:ketosteroid isomerase-like protein
VEATRVISACLACCCGKSLSPKDLIAMTPTIAPNHPQLEMDILIVRGFFEAWAAGDVSRLDLLVDEDVVVAPLLGLLYEREVYRGRSGVAAAFGETAARWHRLEVTVEDVLPADGRLVATVKIVLGKHGMSSELSIRVVCALRDGLIVSLAD